MTDNTYHVRPLPDGVSQLGNWQVRSKGEQVSTHTKKRAAENEARRRATEGDQIILYRVNGTRNDAYTFRGSNDGDGGRSSDGDLFAPTPFDTWVSEESDDSMFF